MKRSTTSRSPLRRPHSPLDRLAAWPWWASLLLGLAVALLLVGGLVLVTRPRATDRGLAGIEHVHALAVWPGDPPQFWLATHRGLYRTRDLGRQWEPGGPVGDVRALALNPATGLLLAAGPGFLKQSGDGGQTWTDLSERLPAQGAVQGLALTPDDPQRLTAYIAGQGVYRSRDGGRSWERVGPPLPNTEVTALVGVPGRPDTLYLGTERLRVLRSTDGGLLWSPVGAGLQGPRVLALSVSPQDPRLVFAATPEGVFRSTDEGRTWQLTGPGLPHRLVEAVAIDPTPPGTVYAVALGLLYRSQDQGLSWQKVTPE